MLDCDAGNHPHAGVDEFYGSRDRCDHQGFAAYRIRLHCEGLRGRTARAFGDNRFDPAAVVFVLTLEKNVLL